MSDMRKEGSEHVNITIWKSTRRLLQLASAWAGASQVQFMHDAVREKIERDEIQLPPNVEK